MPQKKKNTSSKPRPRNNQAPKKKPQQSMPPKKTWNKKPSTTKADTLLHQVGGHGTDPRSQTVQTSSLKEKLQVQSLDPTMDVPAAYNARAIQYLALGTVLRAIKRGIMSTVQGEPYHPYMAWRYLIDAYTAASNGSIPALQQAPQYVWEICYALKPKTESMKTGRVNYTIEVISSGQVDTAAEYPLGPSPSEVYNLFWGINNGSGDVNEFPILTAIVPANYTTAIGENAVKLLWQTFDNQGMNKLVPDPGNEAFLFHDTSAQCASFSEVGSSFFAPGAMATTLYSERYVQCPILSKFCTYQEFQFGFRGWLEFRKSAGSATYIGPRSSELNDPRHFRNKVSPLFCFYNFDEFVEQAALILARGLESASSVTGNVITPYPLSSQQFQIMLRQTLIPYFDNDMAQDLRLSAEDTANVLVTLLPLVVGPNGYSVTQSGGGMKMTRFFAESVRCCRRLTSKIQSRFEDGSGISIIDLVPVLCRPGGLQQLDQYLYVDGRNSGALTPVFATSADQAVDLIQCSAVSGGETVYLDLNGPTVTRYITAHNDWMEKMSGCFTALTDLSATETGVPALNVNPLTAHLQYIFGFPGTSTPATEENSSKKEKDKSSTGPLGPLSRNYVGIQRPEGTMTSSQPQRQTSSKKLPRHVGSRAPSVSIGASPAVGSLYFQNNVGLAKVTSMLPILASFWKYQSVMIKPIWWTTSQQNSGSSLQFQTVQVQPFTLPLSSRNPQFSITTGQLTMPSLLDQHLAAAGYDVKQYNSPVLTEMEVDFNDLQAKGAGGFFSALGKAVGGFIDSVAGG